jgi:hypothetical protein
MMDTIKLILIGYFLKQFGLDLSPRLNRRSFKTKTKAFFNTMVWWGILPTGPLPLPHQ